MANRFGIPELELQKVNARDRFCVYCHKNMVSPRLGSNRSDWATIEHLNFDGPFYWKDGLKMNDIVICCSRCNSSRGAKKLPDWFMSQYCLDRNINESSVAEPVKNYLIRQVAKNK